MNLSVRICDRPVSLPKKREKSFRRMGCRQAKANIRSGEVRFKRKSCYLITWGYKPVDRQFIWAVCGLILVLWMGILSAPITYQCYLLSSHSLLRRGHSSLPVWPVANIELNLCRSPIALICFNFTLWLSFFVIRTEAPLTCSISKWQSLTWWMVFTAL